MFQTTLSCRILIVKFRRSKVAKIQSYSKLSVSLIKKLQATLMIIKVLDMHTTLWKSQDLIKQFFIYCQYVNYSMKKTYMNINFYELLNTWINLYFEISYSVTWPILESVSIQTQHFSELNVSVFSWMLSLILYLRLNSKY